MRNLKSFYLLFLYVINSLQMKICHFKLLYLFLGNFYEHEKPEDQKNGLEHEEKELENIDKHRKSTSFNSSLIIVKQVLFLSGDKEIHVGGKDSKDDTFDQVQSEPSIERLRKSFIREVSSIDRDIESYWRVIMYRKNMSFWAEHEKKRLDREEQEEDDINEEELENEVPEPDHEANDLMNPGPNNDQAQEVQEQEDVDENKQDNEHEHEANDLINPGPNDDQAQGVQEQDEQDNEHEVPEQDNEHEAGLNNDHAQGVAVEVMHVNTMFRPDVFVPA